ncbi:MAG TPA: DUF6510 family protein [Solirubrobacteraceae bacterium]|jgi:hypothetical protein
MEALDGNAIAGALYEYFGTEMTTARGNCAHCRAPAMIAELEVYMRAPGVVVRCWNCHNVVIVLVPVAEPTRVDYSAFELAEPPAPV